MILSHYVENVAELKTTLATALRQSYCWSVCQEEFGCFAEALWGVQHLHTGWIEQNTDLITSGGDFELWQGLLWCFYFLKASLISLFYHEDATVTQTAKLKFSSLKQSLDILVSFPCCENNFSLSRKTDSHNTKGRWLFVLTAKLLMLLEFYSTRTPNATQNPFRKKLQFSCRFSINHVGAPSD